MRIRQVKSKNATKRKPSKNKGLTENTHKNLLKNKNNKILFFLLASMLGLAALILISKPIIDFARSPKKIASKAKEMNLPKLKIAIPLDKDDSSLPKDYDYYTALAKRQVSISVEEIGGQAVRPLKEIPKLGSFSLPPIILVSMNENAEYKQVSSVNNHTSTPINISANPLTNTENLVIPIPGLNPLVSFQAVSLSSKNAQKESNILLNKLKKSNLKAYIETAKNGQGLDVYRIKIGPYPRDQAANIRNKLEEFGLKPLEIYHQ
ncbi:hypothetical protein AwWohl_12940 [Gammaproteobacteria bacterium]|nr:hypothetical protein AwWohl_12940 [Gammaproteobacteria bacterium]